MIVDAHDLPLTVSLTSGHRNDITQLIRWSTRSHRSAAAVAELAAEPQSAAAPRRRDGCAGRRGQPQAPRSGTAHNRIATGRSVSGG
jgi:soluble lytic murein transglycosylase-like protein